MFLFVEYLFVTCSHSLNYANVFSSISEQNTGWMIVAGILAVALAVALVVVGILTWRLRQNETQCKSNAFMNILIFLSGCHVYNLVYCTFFFNNE